jgi:hypothetical protein
MKPVVMLRPVATPYFWSSSATNKLILHRFVRRPLSPDCRRYLFEDERLLDRFL